MITVESVEPVGRAEPDVSLAVLDNGFDMILRKPVIHRQVSEMDFITE